MSDSPFKNGTFAAWVARQQAAMMLEAQSPVAITFSLTELQVEKITKFVTEHECIITNEGSIGGKYTYSFTPTTLGTVDKITCACGKSCDVSNYELW